MQRALAKERASQSKALDLQSQLSRAKTEQSQLQRSKEEVRQNISVHYRLNVIVTCCHQLLFRTRHFHVKHD